MQTKMFSKSLRIILSEKKFSGQRSAEINHKHIPRRMEALRTISNVFLAQPNPSIQEVIARSLLIYDEATGLNATTKKTEGRFLHGKKKRMISGSCRR